MEDLVKNYKPHLTTLRQYLYEINNNKLIHYFMSLSSEPLDYSVV